MSLFTIIEEIQREAQNRYDTLLENDDGVVIEETVISIDSKITQGDICDLYRCDYKGLEAVLKIARSNTDNDLLKDEALVLRDLRASLKEGSTFLKYLPTLLHSGEHEDKSYNVLPYYGDLWVSLEYVLEKKAEGIDYRDMAWMYKRILAGIGVAHEKGLVHGSVTPAHVLIHKEHHGAVLLDWTYTRAIKATPKAYSRKYQSYYPPEVLDKQPMGAQTDIYMAAKIAQALLGKTDTPEEVQKFLKKSLDPVLRRRPDNAWTLHDEWDATLQQLVGPSKYRRFECD